MTTNEHNPITSDLPTDGSNHAAGRVWNKPPKSLRVILAAHERYRQHLLATGADVADAVRWAPPPAAKPRRRRQPSFARLAAKAKALGVVARRFGTRPIRTSRFGSTKDFACRCRLYGHQHVHALVKPLSPPGDLSGQLICGPIEA